VQEKVKGTVSSHKQIFNSLACY